MGHGDGLLSWLLLWKMATGSPQIGKIFLVSCACWLSSSPSVSSKKIMLEMLQLLSWMVLPRKPRFLGMEDGVSKKHRSWFLLHTYRLMQSCFVPDEAAWGIQFHLKTKEKTISIPWRLQMNTSRLHLEEVTRLLFVKLLWKCPTLAGKILAASIMFKGSFRRLCNTLLST